jgi:predicted MFS family arabinose efflux permease
MPVFAQSVLHVGSEGFGFLTASMGIGSLSGAIALAFFSRAEFTRVLIYTGAIVFTVAEILFALSRVYALSIALLVCVGLFSTLFTTTCNTRVLSLTPPQLQGRVMSVYSLFFLGTTPFGSFLSGLVAQRYRAPAALIAGAGITLAFTIFVFFYRPTARAARRAEERALSGE